MKLLFTLTVGLLFFFLLAITSPISAQLGGVNDPTGGGFSLGDLLTRALTIIFALVTFLAVVIFAVGALRYLTSRGDAKAADAARGTMTGAVIGLIIVLGSASVSGVFERVFGISLFGGGPVTGIGLNPVTNQFDLRCAFQLLTGACVGTNYATFGELVTQILRLLLAIGAIAFFFMLLWGGLRYMAARGDEKAVADARSTLTNAAVGFLLMIASLVIIRLIAETLFKAGSLLS